MRKSRPSTMLFKSVDTRLFSFPTMFFVCSSELETSAPILVDLLADWDAELEVRVVGAVVSPPPCSTSLKDSVVSAIDEVSEVAAVDTGVTLPPCNFSEVSAFIRMRSACSNTRCVMMPCTLTSVRVDKNTYHCQLMESKNGETKRASTQTHGRKNA